MNEARRNGLSVAAGGRKIDSEGTVLIRVRVFCVLPVLPIVLKDVLKPGERFRLWVVCVVLIGGGRHMACALV
jgi:hypothetical protein